MSASIGCPGNRVPARDQWMKINPAITSASIAVETRATRRTSMGRYGVRSRGTAGLSSSGSRFASWRRLSSARPATFVRRGSSDSEAVCAIGSGDEGGTSCLGAGVAAGRCRRGSVDGAGAGGEDGADSTTDAGSSADWAAAGTAGASEAGGPPAGCAAGRLRGGVARRFVRLANFGSAEQPQRGKWWAAQVYPKSTVWERIDGAGSERRREGVSCKKEGNEVLPAPTACVGDACGATSCARRQFNHTMWDSARVL